MQRREAIQCRTCGRGGRQGWSTPCAGTTPPGRPTAAARPGPSGSRGCSRRTAATSRRRGRGRTWSRARGSASSACKGPVRPSASQPASQSVSAAQPLPRGVGSFGRAHRPMAGRSCHHAMEAKLGVHHPMKVWSCHHVMKVVLGAHSPDGRAVLSPRPMAAWSCHHAMEGMLTRACMYGMDTLKFSAWFACQTRRTLVMKKVPRLPWSEERFHTPLIRLYLCRSRHR